MSEFGLPQNGFIHVPVDNGDVKVHVWNSRTFWSNKEKKEKEKKKKTLDIYFQICYTGLNLIEIYYVQTP